MQEVTVKRAMMWGDSIVGFGRYYYKYASGREGDFFCYRILTAQAKLYHLDHAGLYRLPAPVEKNR